MAADQRKSSQLAALQIIARLRCLKQSELGRTTLRPPVTPVALGCSLGTGPWASSSRRVANRLCTGAAWPWGKDFGERKRRPLLQHPLIQSCIDPIAVNVCVSPLTDRCRTAGACHSSGRYRRISIDRWSVRSHRASTE